MKVRLVWFAVLTLPLVAQAQTQTVEEVRSESSRNAAIEFKLGSYLPLIDREPTPPIGAPPGHCGRINAS